MPLPLRLLALPVAIAAAATAGHGSLDRSFGKGGVVTTRLGTDGGAAEAIAVQPDGGVVAAGQIRVGARKKAFVLVRYDTNGSLDPGFGRNGTVTIPIDDWGTPALAMQADGKVVAVPVSGEGALVRFDTDGSLDRSFGNDGKVRVPLAVYALAIQPDGKLVVAGHDAKGFALARLDDTGGLDRGFGKSGVVRTGGGADSAILALALEPDGKLIAAGQGADSALLFLLLRYNRNGTLDPSFGKGGKVQTPVATFTFDAEDGALAVQRDGRIVLAGIGTPPRGSPNMYILARFNRNGTPDPSFGKGGAVLTPVRSLEAEAKAVTVQRDGKILLVGDAGPSDVYDVPGPLVRYNRNGTLDDSFGSRGKVTMRFIAGALATQPDGRILAAGYSRAGFTVARYLP